MQAFSYLRVSGEAQISGDGFPRQREAVEKYAAANGIEIIAEFLDEGITGKMELENREGLSSCIAAVQEQKITLVLVEDSTRLARDLIVAEVCIREFQKLGVRVISAAGGVDLTQGDDSNPTAKLIRQILAAVSEFERCCIVMKLKSARQRMKKATGRCEGRIPFGSKPGEAQALHTIRALRASGITCDKIADALNANNVPSRMGKPWRGCTVSRILKRDRTIEPSRPSLTPADGNLLVQPVHSSSSE